MTNFGKLYLVATPIGNLDDITLRALKILTFVDIVAAEDTRQTANLLNHFKIRKPLISYYEQNKFNKSKKIIEFMKERKNVALVSDAGMPTIADPGIELVRLAHKHNIKIEPIPGANAALSALICSSFETTRFSFQGFLPRTKKRSEEVLKQISRYPETIIFYEAPHRLAKTLEIIKIFLGNRRTCISREITKKFEEFRLNTIEEHIMYYKENKSRGEFVIVIEGYIDDRQIQKEQISVTEIIAKFNSLINTGKTKNESLRLLAREYGISRKEIYIKIFIGNKI